jgi:tripartite-type tricarboxylate transporter receptor subunit TctC
MGASRLVTRTAQASPALARAPLRVLALLLLLGATALGSDGAAAQAYPSRPIRIYVGFPPGGGVDIVARLVADKMQQVTGASVVVENHAGASGSLATRQVAALPPDGYTLLMNSNSILANQAINAHAGHDVERELVPVLKAAVQSNIIAVAPGLKVKTLAELLARAKAQELSYGSPGVGSIPHLSAENLFALAGVKLRHVPFPGASPALTATMGGHVDLASVTTPPAIPLVQAGQVIGIAVTGAQREPTLPDVPTVAESGFKGFSSETWAGFFAPAGTPAPVVDWLANAMLKALALPDVKEKLTTLGFAPAATRSAEFSREISAELVQWRDVARKANIKVQ